jgi:hypothetical protein
MNWEYNTVLGHWQKPVSKEEFEAECKDCFKHDLCSVSYYWKTAPKTNKDYANMHSGIGAIGKIYPSGSYYLLKERKEWKLTSESVKYVNNLRIELKQVVTMTETNVSQT